MSKRTRTVIQSGVPAFLFDFQLSAFDYLLSSLRHFAPGFGDGADAHNEISAVYAERDADGIATAGFTNRGNVNRRATVAANNILPILTVTFRAADAAGIERHAPTLRLFDDEKPERLLA